jgi:hypothetical protein
MSFSRPIQWYHSHADLQKIPLLPYPGGKGVPPGVLGQDRSFNRLQLVQL